MWRSLTAATAGAALASIVSYAAPAGAVPGGRLQKPVPASASVPADCAITSSNAGVGTFIYSNMPHGVLTDPRFKTSPTAVTARCTRGTNFTLAFPAGQSQRITLSGPNGATLPARVWVLEQNLGPSSKPSPPTTCPHPPPPPTQLTSATSQQGYRFWLTSCVPAGNTVKTAGTYTGTVTVTLTF